MRRPILLFLSILFSLSAISQESAGAYMSELNSNYREINKDSWSYIKQIARGRNARRIDKKRVELVGTLKQANYTVSQTGTYDGDASLRDAIKSYLSLLILTLNDDYRKIVDMEQIAEESYDAMEAYIMTKERVNEKMDAAQKELENVEAAFANKHHVNLVANDSRVSKKIKNANEVMAYYNRFYLLFYKSYFYEAEMMAAMNAEIIGDVEQYRQTLANVSEESLETLKSFQEFENSSDLKKACHEILYFYHGEAVRYMPEIVTFFVDKKSFEELTAAMESKKPKDRTKEDIDKYNAALNNYNASIQKFNETNAYLNKFREQSFNNWNKVSEDFLDSYM
ncbi:MAG: hypothetical protein RIC35_19405 [Marinoscillum sp.]